MLQRRQVLAGMGTLAATLLTPGSASGSTPPTYYVSATGNDELDGMSPESAWASIQKVNSQVQSGSVILFRRGDTFYGEIALPSSCEAGAYGAGPRPTLTLFKLLNRSDGWVEHSAGQWKINLSRPSTHDGYTNTADANIGFLLVDGVVKPEKKTQLSDATSMWDFWCDVSTSTLFVAADANPTTLAGDIKAAPRGDKGRIIDCSEGPYEIHDLHITGSGGHGIIGAGTDVHVHNNLIENIGGSYLPDYGDGSVRYGNGIENAPGARRWLIEDNEITQTYDVAYSSQGNTYDGAATWEDMTVRNNYIHDCTQSFEFWTRGTSPDAGFRKIVVEDNKCERAGYSAFAASRPNQDVRVHLLTYNWQLPADITVRNNVFLDAFAAYSYFETQPSGLVSRNNTIRLKPGTRIQFQQPQTVEQAQEWQRLTGYESGSTIEPD